MARLWFASPFKRAMHVERQSAEEWQRMLPSKLVSAADAAVNSGNRAHMNMHSQINTGPGSKV